MVQDDGKDLCKFDVFNGEEIDGIGPFWLIAAISMEGEMRVVDGTGERHIIDDAH